MMDKFLTLRLYHDPPLADVQAVIAQAKQAGATGVAVVTTEYVQCEAGSVQIVPSPWGWIWPDQGQAPGLVGNTTPWRTVDAVAQLVVGASLRLLLKPHLDIAWHHPDGTYGYGGWRGYALPPDGMPGGPDYLDFLWPYVRRLRALPRDTIFCLGCELYEFTRHSGAAWWQAVAAWVRRRHRGPLTYAANWGDEVGRLADLWPALDYIGVDAYYPLAAMPTPDPAVLAQGWRAVYAELAPLLARAGRPVLFTEVGYRNDARCMVDPYADPAPDAVPADAGQAACWAAFHAAWPDVPFVAWDGPVVGQEPPAISMDVLRTPELARRVFGA